MNSKRNWMILNVLLITLIIIVISRYYIFIDYENYLTQVGRRQVISLQEEQPVSKQSNFIEDKQFCNKADNFL